MERPGRHRYPDLLKMLPVANRVLCRASRIDEQKLLCLFVSTRLLQSDNAAMNGHLLLAAGGFADDCYSAHYHRDHAISVY